ncbi:hypothetical protein L6452_37127 [Arctium lappa]|uniref:Uncharacterized protein n=1 Tax=Arctium lappa TaxID=4217 RepID=A0ACB8Y2M3_ARCLA|nr:hypothetical protein L6452_37127 [Arctium lappa]
MYEVVCCKTLRVSHLEIVTTCPPLGLFRSGPVLMIYQFYPNNKEYLINCGVEKQSAEYALMFWVAIDAPGGFLLECWSVLWDIFIARTTEKHSEAAAAYIEVFTISVIFVKDGVPGLGKDYQRIAKAQKLVLQHWLEASSNFHLRTNSSEIEKERLETEDADLYHIPERTVIL